MADKKNYKWKYCSMGGVTRVNIATGEDIAHLGELDEKLWTVLSCPTKGLEFDERTLQLLDTDGDGKIRVTEIVNTAQWLTRVLKNPDTLIKGDSELPLSELNTADEEGRRLLNSAEQVLANLKLSKDSISIADMQDRAAIFAKTRFNGDGIITPTSAEDETLAQIIKDIIAIYGSCTDRSGEEGVDTDKIEQFYNACKEYRDWYTSVDAVTKEPFGSDTEAAHKACEAMKDKIADYFMRCKLVSFNEECTSALDFTLERVAAIGSDDLTTRADEIATYPLARPSKEAVLPLNGGLNPAWSDKFDELKRLVLDHEYPNQESITEAQWKAVVGKFEAYNQWMAGQKSAEVATLGIERINELVESDTKKSLIELVEQDNALKDEAESIANVEKLLLFNRDFFTLLRNYVFFYDFYSRDKNHKAIFQAGRLYIDQRCLDLCIKVDDMGKQADMANLSGMYLIYCSCTSKTKNQTIDIVAVLTDGDVDDLRVGKNAVFYDRNGLDWDATVTKIIENPVSIRQAFWSPYKKVVRLIEDRINKMAADKDAKVIENATANIDEKTNNLTATEGAADEVGASKKKFFDIAKFAGIFATIGLAFGLIGNALKGLGSFVTAHWYNIFIIVGAVIILVSGPSIFIAWSKLRRRNLGPVLNANGWAINARVLVNTRFGATLTSLASYPKLQTNDPFADHTPAWKRWLRTILIILVIVFAFLFFTNRLSGIGLPFNKQSDAAAVEQPTDQPADAEADAAAM